MRRISYLQSGIATVALLVLLGAGSALCLVIPDRSANSPSVLLDRLYIQRDTAWEMRLEVPQQLVIGSTEASVTLHTSRPGSYYLIQAGTDGRSLQLIFPNALDSDNLVSAGRTALPRANWRFAVAGPAGTGKLLALITPVPLSSAALRADLARGSLPQLASGYGAALITWQEIEKRDDLHAPATSKP